MSGGEGLRFKVRPDALASYAGIYEFASGRQAVFTVTADMLFVQGLNEPKLPLLAESETRFQSTATTSSYEFVKDAQGQITQVIMHADAGDQKGARKK
jgi:hypothetical protein